jgi:hypothetical protein
MIIALIVLIGFIIAPFALGYATARMAATTLPAASLIAAVAAYVADPPTGRDELEVLSSFWVLGSVAAIASCVTGVAVARQRRRTR